MILLSNCAPGGIGDYSAPITPSCTWDAEEAIFYSNVNISYPYSGLSIFHQNQLGGNANHRDFTFTDVMLRTGSAFNSDVEAKFTANAKITEGCVGEKSVTYLKDSPKILPQAILMPQPSEAFSKGDVTVTFNTDTYINENGGGNYYYIKFEKTSQLVVGNPIDGTFVGKKFALSFKSETQAEAYRKRLVLEGGKVYKDGETLTL